jgi:hypothetical protein
LDFVKWYVKLPFPSFLFTISERGLIFEGCPASPEDGKIDLKYICIFSSCRPEITLRLQWKSKKANAAEKNNSFLL